MTSLIGWENKRVDKRFTSASLSYSKLVYKLEVTLLSCQFDLMITEFIISVFDKPMRSINLKS